MKAVDKAQTAKPLIEVLEARLLYSATVDVILVDSALAQQDLLEQAAADADHYYVYNSSNTSAAQIVADIGEWAQQHQTKIDSLTLISHGNEGSFQLGKDTFTTANVQASNDIWARLGETLADDANIYLYGCEVGAGGEGQALLDRLAEATHADVFGSSNMTGAGGDWNLEAASIGDEQELQYGLAVPLDTQMLEDYSYSLATTSAGAGIASNSATGGTTSTNALVDNDGSYVQVSGQANNATWTQYYRNFGLSVPDGATIDGITLNINGRSTSTGTSGTLNFTAQISFDGGNTWTSTLATTTSSGAYSSYSNYDVVIGSSSNDWGHDSAGTNFASGFIVRVDTKMPSGVGFYYTIQSDYVGATVTYTAGSNTAPTTSGLATQNLSEDFSSYTIDLKNIFADAQTTDANLIYSVSGNSNVGVSIGANGIATISSTANWNGAENITFTAQDQGGLTVSTSANFAVAAVNDTPTTSGLATQNRSEDFSSYTIDLKTIFADVETSDANLIYSVSGNSNVGVSIGANGIATISSTANWNGTENITFTAQDQGGLTVSTSANFVIAAVNDTPTTSGLATQNLSEDFSSYTIDLRNIFADVETSDANLIYSVSGNSNVGVSIVNGVATITAATANWNGTENLTFTAQDQGGLTVSTSANFVVAAVNDTPTTSGLATQNLSEDFSSYTIDLKTIFADVETSDANLIYTVSGNSNVGVSIGANGIATISSTANWNGTENITFTARDQGSLTVSTSANFVVAAVNDTPTTSGLATQNISEDFSSYTIDLKTIFADVETSDANLIYSVSGNSNVGVSIGANGIATISSTANWNGTENITFTAQDQGGLTVSTSANFVVAAVNDTPTTSGLATQNLGEDFSSYTIDLRNIFADVETSDANLVYSVSGNTNIGVSIVNGVATISAATANWNGTENLTFTARDQGSLTVSTSANFVVAAVNDTPTTSGLTTQNLSEDFSNYTIDLRNIFADVETSDANLIYSVSGNSNVGVSIVNGVATISAATANWNGTENLTFTAQDQGGLTVSTSANFVVAAVNDTPTTSGLATQNLSEDFSNYTIDLKNIFADVETSDGNLIYSVSGNSNVGISIDANGIATISSTANWNGTENITFTAQDQGGLMVSTSANFVVAAVNDTPTTSGLANQNLTEDFANYTIDLKNIFADVETSDANLIYSVSGNSNVGVSISNGVATISNLTPNWNGTETLTFMAEDQGGLTVSAAADFIIAVSVNDTPTTTGLTTQNLSEDFSSYTIDLKTIFADAETSDANLIYSVSGNSNIGVSIVNGVATISAATANWSGTENLTFAAQDQGGLIVSTSADFIVAAVNDTPTTSGLATQNLSEDFASYTIDLKNIFADVETSDANLVYSVSGNSNIGVSIDSNGIATITAATANWNGTENLTFTAEDQGGLTISASAAFNVAAANDTPTTSGLATQNLSEDFAGYTIDLKNIFADVETSDANLIYSVSGNSNIGVSIDYNGIATITATSNWNGTENLTFTAQDQGGLMVSTSADFIVAAVNDTPTTSGLAAQNLTQDFANYTIDLKNIFADIETSDANLIYSVSGNSNIGVSIDSNGIATITSTTSWNGTENITFTAEDQAGLTTSTSADFNVAAVNSAPTTGGLTTQNLSEDFASYTIDLKNIFADIETSDANLIYSVSGNSNVGISIDANGIATISSTANWSGTENITFTAQDQGGMTVSTSADFNVAAVNDAPATSGLTTQNLNEDFASYTIDLKNIFADIETSDANLVYSVSGNSNVGISIDANGIATISPTANWNGTENITFTAEDQGGLTVSASADFIVVADNDTPTTGGLATQNLIEDFASYTIDLKTIFSDIETSDANLIYSVSGNSNIGVSIDSNGIATISPTANWNGTENITFTAHDQGGLTISTSADFIVAAANDTPTTSGLATQNLTENFSNYTIDLKNIFADLETSDTNLIYSVSGNSNINISIDSNGIATITSTANWNGTENITFTAEDQGGLTISSSAGFIVAAVNDTPTTSGLATQNLSEDFTSYTIDLKNIFADIETSDANLIYGVSGNSNIGVSIDSNGIATISSTSNWGGTENLTFTAQDQSGATVSTSADFIVANVNDAPNTSGLTTQNLIEDFTSYTIDLKNIFNDAETVSADLIYSVSGNSNIGVTIDSNGIATITSTTNWSGTENIIFTAEDASGATIDASADFIVAAANNVPTTSGIAAQNLVEDFPSYTIDLKNIFADVETSDTNLIYSVSGNSNIGVSIDSNGVATITSTANWSGTENISFTALDQSGASVSASANFTVAAVNDAPTTSGLSNQNLQTDFPSYTIDLKTIFADIETSAAGLIYSVSGNNNIGVSIDGNGIATIRAVTPHWHGTESIMFTAQDASGMTIGAQADFIVASVIVPPILTPDNENSEIGGGPSTPSTSNPPPSDNNTSESAGDTNSGDDEQKDEVTTVIREPDTDDYSDLLLDDFLQTKPSIVASIVALSESDDLLGTLGLTSGDDSRSQKPGNLSILEWMKGNVDTPFNHNRAITKMFEGDDLLKGHDWLWKKLDAIDDDIKKEHDKKELIVQGIKSIGSVTVSVAATWFLRAAALSSSMFAAIPAWRNMDILMVLDRDKRKFRDEKIDEEHHMEKMFSE